MKRHSDVDMAWRNRQKVIRAGIRMRYAIAADNEINSVLAEEYKKFYKSVQEGKMLPPLDPKKVIDAKASPHS